MILLCVRGRKSLFEPFEPSAHAPHCATRSRLHWSYSLRVNTVNGTVSSAPSGRRVVRRRARPTFDKAWDIALAELPPEIRPAMRAYVEAKQAEFAARSALSTAMTGCGIRRYQVDRLAHELTYAT
jgi:hypothetical protein